MVTFLWWSYQICFFHLLRVYFLRLDIQKNRRKSSKLWPMYQASITFQKCWLLAPPPLPTHTHAHSLYFLGLCAKRDRFAWALVSCHLITSFSNCKAFYRTLTSWVPSKLIACTLSPCFSLKSQLLYVP